MKRILTTALALAALLAGAASEAQAPTRIRGIISAASGDSIAVKTGDGRQVDVQLAPTTAVVFAEPIALSEIKSGDFVAVTSVRRKDGTLTAYDVRRFIKPSNPGHRPFDGGDDQTMTNATVSAMVESAGSRELALSYEGGSQKIIVSQGASVTTLVPGNRAQLTAGSYVNLLAEPDAAGKLAARSIEVRKDAPKAP
jgi:hypothetical protein